MRKIYLLFSIVVLSITFGCDLNGGDQSFAVKSDEDSYEFKAKYPRHKTKELVGYIKQSLHQADLLNSADGVKKDNLTLRDGTRFYIDSEPGYLEISFKKRNNSKESYQRMIAFCMGIKAHLR